MVTTEEKQYTCNRCGRTGPATFMSDYYPDTKSDDPDAVMCERCMMREHFASTSADPVPVPEGYDDEVCKKGQGETTCAFLVITPDFKCFKCSKGSSFESTIRARLVEGTMNARSDNCSGPPDFTPTT